MTLKSTNIWDDIREEASEDNEGGTLRRRKISCSSLQSYKSKQNSLHPSQANAGRQHHANRHGISMKSEFKSRKV